ncbi:MAG TPA: MBL fold metallo-hydrolase [Solirubrobacteraceae bacterium]|nr:MBL fold metallo-hydrolase [Solirubrobacteraceae bacterium]
MSSHAGARPSPLRSRPRLRQIASAPPEPIADGVWLLRGGLARSMNVYLLEDAGSGGVVAYDAGEKAMAAPVLAAARERGGLARVVLGHADTDHRGAAPALRAYAGVVCHPDAVAQAQGSGGRDYWRMDELPLDVRLLHGFLHRFVWDGGPVQIDGTVREGDAVAGFEVIELAGHAPGLIGLWRERDRLALVSDCIYISDMHGKPQPPAVPLDAYNLDTAQARAAVAKLAALKPRIVCPGHLGPLEGPDVVEQLEAAAAA